MPMTHYRRMSPVQARAALGEFLAERVPALQRLRAELTAQGIDPETLLDGSPQSLTPLWEWIVERRAELSAGRSTAPSLEPRSRWPSWARHTVTSMHVPSATMFVLLDGLVSYLAQVLITGAPTAFWGLGSPEDARHHLHHHPVLTGAGQQIFVPTLPMAGMLRLKLGEASLREGELTGYAVAMIGSLHEEIPPPAGDPPVVVVAAPESFDVGVRGDIANGHAGLLRRMSTELAAQDGIVAVDRAAVDALEVRAPGWEADALHRWLSAWLRTRLPFDR
ncbi:hypothetical protein [Kocuria rhizosphaericola]|uniref:hypothetical protein n=1 Tax=Kocuria rhizosphaericola TaxID=3376284 RepID=UPI0037B40E11